MDLFSQRHGFKPKKSVIQMNDMNIDLRNSIWNALEISYWSSFDSRYELHIQQHEHELVTKLWLNYFKLPLDEMPDSSMVVKDFIRKYFFDCDWCEVYDFIEFIANNYYFESVSEEFKTYCNVVLERELSGYRFIGEKIVPITTKEEISEVEEVLEYTGSLKPVAIHMKESLKLFSDRKSPDYRNSTKESISAVEAICNLITDNSRATLGDALKVLTNNIEIHPPLQQSFIKLYGYTSDAEGIRHALLNEPNLNFEDAKFMLVSCSAFINYLKMKASKAGIKLETK